ncbi:MAG: hypothetical protein E4H19_11470 [Chromatiales bacterium]|nr:MAG: hypothetical protein E4H19_11470 [Chromatiales bacterium]
MSMRRTSRRYLRGAVDTTHDFQEFLNENPAVASGLASVGSLLLNAMMQSKYGPTIEGLLNPGAKTEAVGGGTTAQASPKAAPAKPAAAKVKPKAKAKPKPKAKSPRRVVKKASKKK